MSRVPRRLLVLSVVLAMAVAATLAVVVALRANTPGAPAVLRIATGDVQGSFADHGVALRDVSGRDNPQHCGELVSSNRAVDVFVCDSIRLADLTFPMARVPAPGSEVRGFREVAPASGFLYEGSESESRWVLLLVARGNVLVTYSGDDPHLVEQVAAALCALPRTTHDPIGLTCA